jgi:membrane associated rhomboid family serine protease
MFRNLFANMPPVVKNLLILNVLFFLAKLAIEAQGLNAGEILGLHYPSSELFRPYQIATHFFMHGDFLHILFNMFGLVILGSHLERHWGPKRFLTFYFVTAVGAAILYMTVQGIQVYNFTGEIFPDFTVHIIEQTESGFTYYTEPIGVGYNDAAQIYLRHAVGASGAIYGLILAFAMLFPNTEFMLLFPPIPIKAKWLALILGGIALYAGVTGSMDGVAHFAHLGGMVFGFILVKIWQRDKSKFY